MEREFIVKKKCGREGSGCHEMVRDELHRT
jgi:hypothetical protein